MRIDNPAAAGAEHVPCQFEQAEPGGMEEAGNHPLFVQPGALGEIQQIDPVEPVILALLDQVHDRICDRGIGGLPQNGKLCLGIAHSDDLD